MVVGVGTLLGAWSWWEGFLSSIVPPPARVALAVENWWSETATRSEDGFRVVVCWLENDDPRGADTKNVARAFASVHGIKLVRVPAHHIWH